ncbi:TauD/TfdA family dioxygenase [Glycocaulis profundi]|nr:TauD/TfdA family dioxygenase [Glycocaulis profundi]
MPDIAAAWTAARAWAGRRAPDPDQGLAETVAAALCAPPFHIVLSDFGTGDDPEPIQALALAIASMPDARGRRLAEPKVDFTRVRVDPDSSDRKGASTRLSRTHLPLPAHTDASYSANPHQLAAFQMVRADAQGGESAVVTAVEICDALEPETLTALREPVFPFGKSLKPILWGPEGDERIRYYRVQLDAGIADGAQVSARHMAAVRALDAALEDPAPGRRFRLENGQILLINNVRALHGRTGFSPGSGRLMLRIRARAPRLA